MKDRAAAKRGGCVPGGGGSFLRKSGSARKRDRAHFKSLGPVAGFVE
jgi:hypothetical protein